VAKITKVRVTAVDKSDRPFISFLSYLVLVNGKIVIVVYRPRNGKEKLLEQVVSKHLDVLRSEDLVTDRQPMVMRSSDGCIVEVFEWRSKEAIDAAHHNPRVQDLWAEFSAVCEYDAPVNVREFHNLFAEFEPINFK
jgi:hypothetical protein